MAIFSGMAFDNTYADPGYAGAYARLEFAGTYHLAYRDLPELLRRYAPGPRALDFGCGTGRSTRFLKSLGFAAVGVDISEGMLELARRADPGGDYRISDLTDLPDRACDVALAAFTFDNVQDRATLLARLARVARVIVLVVSTPDIYTHEWVSFTTRDFAANFTAKAGDIVRTRIRGIGDERPVDDILWPDASYRATFAAAGLAVLEHRTPLATGTEGEAWISETTVAPWSVYVLRPT